VPNVFVKFTDKPHVQVSANAGDSVDAIVRRAYNAAYAGSTMPAAVELKVSRGSKVLYNLSHTVAELDIRENETLNVELPRTMEPMRDDGVLDTLRRFLRVSAGELGDGEVTFISVACFDNNHGWDSIIRQQCPVQLLRYCVNNGIDLNIILIDPAFADSSLKYPQIYDQQEWRLLSQEDDGKVRQYSYTPSVSAGACDVWLTVFSASLSEFSMELRDKGKIIAGLSMPEMFAVLQSSTITRSCLICGCFAFPELNARQYFTLGASEVIKGTGFAVNPP